MRRITLDSARQRIPWALLPLYVIAPGVASTVAIHAGQRYLGHADLLHMATGLALGGACIWGIVRLYREMRRPGTLAILSLCSAGCVVGGWFTGIEGGHTDARFLVISGPAFLVLVAASYLLFGLWLQSTWRRWRAGRRTP